MQNSMRSSFLDAGATSPAAPAAVSAAPAPVKPAAGYKLSGEELKELLTTGKCPNYGLSVDLKDPIVQAAAAGLGDSSEPDQTEGDADDEERL